MSDEEKFKMKERAFNFVQKYHSCKTRMAETIELIKGNRNTLNIFLNDLKEV